MLRATGHARMVTLTCSSNQVLTHTHAARAACVSTWLTGDARPRFALLEEQVRRARSDDGRL